MQPNTGPRRRPDTSRSSRVTRNPGDIDVVGARIGAQIVDLIAIFVIGILGAVLVGVGLQSKAIAFLVFIVVTLAYGTILEGAKGQTLGKMLAGVRVVDATGDGVGYGQAFIRNIPALFGGWLTWLVGMAAIAIDDDNQRVFDEVAGTYVVRD